MWLMLMFYCDYFVDFVYGTQAFYGWPGIFYSQVEDVEIIYKQ